MLLDIYMLCLITGCSNADIDECLDRKQYTCHGVCTNTDGSFTCDCPTGTRGNASIGECHKDPFPPRATTGDGFFAECPRLCRVFFIGTR